LAAVQTQLTHHAKEEELRSHYTCIGIFLALMYCHLLLILGKMTTYCTHVFLQQI